MQGRLIKYEYVIGSFSYFLPRITTEKVYIFPKTEKNDPTDEMAVGSRYAEFVHFFTLINYPPSPFLADQKR